MKKTILGVLTFSLVALVAGNGSSTEPTTTDTTKVDTTVKADTTKVSLDTLKTDTVSVQKPKQAVNKN